VTPEEREKMSFFLLIAFSAALLVLTGIVVTVRK